MAQPLYTSLDQSKREIRLLRLQPSEADNVLSICECTMFKACLSDQPPPVYNAFSYEWDMNDALASDYGYSATDAVVINGQRVQATKNLVALLTRWRNLAHGLTDFECFQIPIWIDAICINQADNEEKSHQVALMGSIYKEAKATLSWLGESDDDSDYALTTIVELGGKIIDAPKTAKDKDEDFLSLIDFHEQPELWKWDGSLNRFWKSISSILERTYWKRAWIVQEVLLQNNGILICGKTFCHNLHLEAIYHWVKRLKGRCCPAGVDQGLWGLLSTLRGWHLMGWSNMNFQDRLHWPSVDEEDGTGDVAGGDDKEERLRHGYRLWNQWVVRTMFKQASDPRDKLYSVLGLVGVQELKPNYASSVEEVYYDYAAMCIRLRRSLSILRHAGHCELSAASEQTPPTRLFVPSWVPNWDHISKTYNFTWLHGIVNSADENWESVIPAMGVPWSIDGYTLRTPGVLFDSVSETRHVGLHDGSWVAFCHEYLESRTGQLYPSGIPVLQAFAWLLLRGRGLDGEHLGTEPSLEKLLGDVLTMFLGSLYSDESDTQLGDMRREQQRFGLHDPQEVLANFIGQNVGKVPRERTGGPRTTDVNAEETKRKWTWTLGRVDTRYEVGKGMREHQLVVTTKGFLGWSRRGAKQGDLVCVLPGSSMPVMLRRVDGRGNGHGRCIHLGSCHVTGLMDGEGIVSAREGTAPVEHFDIV